MKTINNLTTNFLLKAITFSIALSLISASTSLQAGQITTFTWSSGVASVGLGAIAPPVLINNDDHVGASPNEVNIFQKDYVGIGPVDIEFVVIPSGGTTEYAFIEGVQNGTGSAWSDYHMQLGFGMGADFVPSPSGDGLDFDAPDYNSPFSLLPFTTVDVFEDDIDAYDGIIPDFTFVAPFLFTIDVPDGITSFTIRQYPTTDFIPEPTSAVLALIATAGFCGATRRRRN